MRTAFAYISVCCRGGSLPHPRGGHVTPAQVAQGAVGVDAALLNLPHRGSSAVAAVLWVPLAKAGPRITTPKGAAALGLFLCS